MPVKARVGNMESVRGRVFPNKEEGYQTVRKKALYAKNLLLELKEDLWHGPTNDEVRLLLDKYKNWTFIYLNVIQ